MTIMTFQTFFAGAALATLTFAACTDRPASSASTDTPATPAEIPGTDTAVGCAGCDRARFRQAGAGAFEYRYPRYTVRVVPHGEDVGEDVTVTPDSGRPLTIDMPMDGYFFGLRSDHLLIDAGTGPDVRTLVVVDLRQNKPVWETAYAGDVTLDAGGTIELLVPVAENDIKTKPLCPEGAEWTANGLSLGYGQLHRFDLANGQDKALAEFRCFPLQ
jgi:hypothetical protein